MLKFPMIFADHMVLQREKPISVWGEAAPGEKIRITLGGTKTETAADNDGSWRAVLPELAAGERNPLIRFFD